MAAERSFTVLGRGAAAEPAVGVERRFTKAAVLFTWPVDLSTWQFRDFVCEDFATVANSRPKAASRQAPLASSDRSAATSLLAASVTPSAVKVKRGSASGSTGDEGMANIDDNEDTATVVRSLEPDLMAEEPARGAAPVNSETCIVCNSDGDVFCCDACPRSFHGM